MSASFAFAMFIFILCLSRSESKVIECTRVQRNSTCFISDVSFQSSSDEESVVFPKSQHIIFETSKILHFSTHLFDALAETAFLTIKTSQIPTITFRSNELHCLRIDNTGLSDFAVMPTDNHNLNTLIINGNPLSIIPRSIKHLTALSILDLSNNQIEHINLNLFQTMTNLLVLDLSANSIAHLMVHPTLQLGRLKNFWINHNQLREIGFFPNCMPSLLRVKLVDNKWSCEWVERVRESIWNSSIEVHGAEIICVDKLKGGLCCYQTPTGSFREAAHDNRQRTIELLPQAQQNNLRQEDIRVRENHLNDVQEQRYRKLIEEKDLLEKRFVNTVRELERTIQRLTAELMEAHDAIRFHKLVVQ